jgi:hypothetical protein
MSAARPNGSEHVSLDSPADLAASMSSPKFTKHATTRAVQRNVPPLVVELLLSYGLVARSSGAERIALDKRGRKRLARDIGSAAYEALRPLLDTYVILSDDGPVITVARRTKRFRH